MKKFTNTRVTLDTWIRAAVDLDVSFSVEVSELGWHFTTGKEFEAK